MSAVSNPFAPSEKQVTQKDSFDIRDELMGNDLLVTGPVKPGLSPMLEAPSETWAVSDVGAFEGIAVMGLHGGAGASTLASLLGDGASEVGQAWPISQNAWTGSACTGSPVPAAAPIPMWCARWPRRSRPRVACACGAASWARP